jgi:hypothetical protein
MAKQLYQWKLMSTGLAGNPKIVRVKDVKKRFNNYENK